jgi:GNAT superfamily N-acetyltransferase
LGHSGTQGTGIYIRRDERDEQHFFELGARGESPAGGARRPPAEGNSPPGDTYSVKGTAPVGAPTKLAKPFQLMDIRIRPVIDGERDWIRSVTCSCWGAESVVVHGTLYYPHQLEGFVALDASSERVGLITFIIHRQECEIVTLNSFREREGVGSALIDMVVDWCLRTDCTRLWLVTTNDNIPALRFYQKRGFHISSVHQGAVDRSRALKPSIPLTGWEGIPLRDEIELEMTLRKT